MIQLDEYAFLSMHLASSFIPSTFFEIETHMTLVYKALAEQQEHLTRAWSMCNRKQPETSVFPST